MLATVAVASVLTACSSSTPATNTSRPTNSHVSYDKYSLMINGKRTVLRIADLHYARMPSPNAWPRVLAEVKAAGFNAVDTLVPWSYHEPAPGQFRFDGQYDLERFLGDARDAGLYVIVRPGPNVTGGIEGAGFPSWLLGQPGYLRTNDPSYARQWHKWFANVVPRIARWQIGGSKNGSVILVVAENEYFGVGPGPTAYANDLYVTLRKLGLTVPIVANDPTDNPALPLARRADLYGFDQYPLPCSTPCAPKDFGAPWSTQTFTQVPQFNKTSFDGVEAYFRGAGVTSTPLYAAEMSGGYYPAQYGYGSQSPQSATTDLKGFTTVSQLSALGQGVTMFGPWVAYGGTSWGYLPTEAFASTYDWLSPITPSDAPGARFGETRLVNNQIQADEASLAATERDPSAVTSNDPATLYSVRRSVVDQSLHIFLRNADPGPSKSVSLQIGTTQLPDVAVPGQSARYLLANANLNGWHVQWSTAEVLMARPDVLVLFGDKGAQYHAQIDGAAVDVTVGPDPQLVPHAPGKSLLVLDRDAAARTWVSGNDIAVGPALVTPNGMETDGPTTALVISGGQVRTEALSGPPPVADLHLSQPSDWRFKSDSAERLPEFDDSQWIAANHATTSTNSVQPLTSPVLYADEYGQPTGYVWYRGHFNGAATGMCIEGRTRYQVWLNGVPVSTFSPTPEQATENAGGTGPPVDQVVHVQFPPGAVRDGANVVSVLTDDWGHVLDVNAQNWAKTPRGLWSAALDTGAGATCGHFVSGVPEAPGVVPAQPPEPRATDGHIRWMLQGGRLSDYPNASGLGGERSGWYAPDYDDSSWTSITLPDRGNLSEDDIGWYRARFDLKLPSCVRAAVAVDLPGSGRPADLYVNGVHIARPSRDAASAYMIPSGILNTGGSNTLAVAHWALGGVAMPDVTLAVTDVSRTCEFRLSRS